MARFTRRALPCALILLAGVFAAAGIARGDVQRVISNATLLCYSCIGLK